ncbi:zinc-dependent alcohol dehydrogenase [Flavilitoribacter nigricans]|uniref:Zn-dependent alcohol dehydrogenase n=1 Tax=Flavilitoribacter nigricans (strain ATCC 23147 / DSM 23189 / NBRC 102662 / NCIMB 1420 / SS-2) TaxID=1122177 RepID=A0A2D0N3N5_FLAN2|nr:alcohol dehydrogenase catalytic domain-containing protein [Flavilitoribacter nigricans]PHN02759.1 Zn-dependent alcohol dehydrogenase [Flavilitoribacter nigricans DSM 23189 = NBRC 102662]
MKATFYQGDHKFSISEKSISDPAEGEVRIKVAYCGICGTDVHIYHGMMDKRVKVPVTIGHEMSGVIDAVGAGVSDFSVGDKVVVRPLDDRGAQASDKGYDHICQDLKFIGIDSPGAMQQYWNVPAFTLHRLRPETDLKLAALVEPLAVACHDVRLSGLKAGEVAVVLGGGPIGLLVALVARETGAKVFISEVNPRRILLARELGFSVINPAETDPVAHLREKTSGFMADVVFEVAGVQPTLDIMTELAGIRGRIVMVAIHGQPKPINLFQFFWKELQLIGARVYEREDYDQAIELIMKNELPFACLITRVAPLTSIQRVFEEIDRQPDGMKVLLDCQT